MAYTQQMNGLVDVMLGKNSMANYLPLKSI